MKKLYAGIIASILLVGCVPAEPKKMCDEGRAIYYDRGGRNGGVAIVENAPECSHTAGNEAEGEVN